MVHSRQACSKAVDVEAELSHRLRNAIRLSEARFASRIVKEHVFRTRIGGADLAPTAGQVCQSFIVVLKCMTRIGRSPGCMPPICCPKVARLDTDLVDRRRRCAPSVPRSPSSSTARRKSSLTRYRIVGVLAGNRQIGFRIPVGVVDRVKFDVGISLLGEAGSPAGYSSPGSLAFLARLFDFALQAPDSSKGRNNHHHRALAIDAGFHDRRHVPVETIFEPVTIAATFCSSFTFQLMYSSISGWSISTTTILAARRVVPPDLIAPAARSPIFRKRHQPGRTCRRRKAVRFQPRI